VQPLRPLVCLEAEVQAVRVRPQLVPVLVEGSGAPAYRGDVEVLVPVRVGGGVRAHVVDRATAAAGERLGPPIASIASQNAPAPRPHLSHGPAGFRDLSRGIGGISDSVLSERLGDLTAGGLITRTVRDGPPVTVTYQLTDRGRALMPALDQIARWARDNLPPGKC
jgi:DNA-binding transcriptional ArsR family regulator